MQSNNPIFSRSDEFKAGGQVPTNDPSTWGTGGGGTEHETSPRGLGLAFRHGASPLDGWAMDFFAYSRRRRPCPQWPVHQNRTSLLGENAQRPPNSYSMSKPWASTLKKAFMNPASAA